ncbi:hypothetical protein [Natronococcus wangiae]|uniref:hypothetical protein n=1 Tax=Natronococcus wangiae TaxID=3068275 RepID=UPI00274000F9|nr:hypothetical protein [Natronococcus sp. AD5]
MRRSIVIAAALLVLAFVFVGGPSMFLSLTSEQESPPADTGTEPAPEVVELEDSESGFWKYLSPRRGFQKRSPVNVIVRGDVDDVERILTESSGGDWSEVNESEEEAQSDTYALGGGNASDNETEPENETPPTANETSSENESSPENGTSSAENEASSEDETPLRANEASLAAEEALPAANEMSSENESSPENGTPSAGNESPADEPSRNTTNEDENRSDENRSNESQPRIPDFDWGSADGGTRYAYIDPGGDESGYWTTETRQLQDGNYYGHRYHIRLYESPNDDDDWVAMQTHTEHFDWFTLRHRVDGAKAAQKKVESDFMAHPRVDTQDDVSRIYLANGGPSDTDGWTTRIEIAGLLVVPTLVGIRIRRRAAGGPSEAERSAADRVVQRIPAAIDGHLTDVDRRRIAAAYDRLEAGHLLLVFTVIALYLGVRIGGIFLENRAAFLTPHQIAALLYPVIGVGIPTATYLIARGLTRRLDAAVVAGASLAISIWLDYGLLGVDTLPIDVVVQRMLVVVALGLIAGGAAKRATRESRFNDLLLVGVAMWVLVLVGTLFGHL